jgi:hypothetical protein
MGNEDPWFVLLLGAFTLLAIAIAVFIPIKMVQLIMREWRRGKRF